MAIFLGSSNFSGSNGSHFATNVYLDSYSQDINANRTDYTLHLYAGSVDGWTGYGVAINGYLQGVATGSTTSFPARTQVDMGTYSGSITHNADGTAWLGVTGYVNANAWSGVGEATVSTGWAPPTIPRSASITVSGGHIGEVEKITINRLTTAFTYNLRYSLKDDSGTEQTGTIATGINQDSYDWTIPTTFYQYWTTGSVRYCTVYCDTYNGGNLVGTSSTNIQISVNTNTKPDITNYNFIDMNSKTVALTKKNGKMVQGYSVGHLSFTATLNYYSKVDRVVDEDGNPVDYEIVSNTEQKQVISIEKDYTDFSVIHTIWVWDGRGAAGRIGLRTKNMATFPPAVKTIVYERVDYIPLTLSMTAKRPSATTGEIEVTFSGNYFNASFGAVTNTLELSWKYRQKGVETWTDGGTFTKDTDYEITGNTFNSKGAISLGNIFDYRNIYEIAIYYKDKLVNTYTSKTVTRGLPIFWWNKDGVYDGNNKKFLVEGDVSSGDILPIGSMIPYGNDTAPENWLICDGSEVSRTTYAELFNVIGTSYGSGDGSTTFNLPNKKGRVSVGLDSDDSDFNSIGKHNGEKKHQLKIEEMPSHNHKIYGNPYGSATWIDGVQRMKYDVNAKTASDTYQLDAPILNNGGGQAHNNLQPYEVDNWIIKASKTTSTPTKSEVTNTYSKSENSVYSCNYINEKLDALYKMIQ